MHFNIYVSKLRLQWNNDEQQIFEGALIKLASISLILHVYKQVWIRKDDGGVSLCF